MGAIYLNGIKYGGGGGTEVVPNPEGEATTALEKIGIDGDIYSVGGGATGDYMEKENPTGWGTLSSTANEIEHDNGYNIIWGLNSTVNATESSIFGTGHQVTTAENCNITGLNNTVAAKYSNVNGHMNTAIPAEGNSREYLLDVNVEGYQNLVELDRVHVEGWGSSAYAESTAVGTYNDVQGSHVEGFENKFIKQGTNAVIGNHIEGNSNTAVGFPQGLHVEGSLNNFTGNFAHQSGAGMHIEGNNNTLTCNTYPFQCEGTHIEGFQNSITNSTEINDGGSHIEGQNNRLTYVSGPYESPYGNHIEGQGNNITSKMSASHVEGSSHVINNYEFRYSHIEGHQTTAQYALYCAHIEGKDHTISTPINNSHIEGYNHIIVGNPSDPLYYTHVEGQGHTVINAINCHIEGKGCMTAQYGTNQHIQGKYNIPDNNKAFIIGNGTANNARSNAFTVDWNGAAELQGDLTVHYGGSAYNVGACLSTASGGGGGSSHSYSTSEQAVGTWIDGSTVYERTVVSSPMPYTSSTQEIADITDWNLGVVVSFAPIIQQGFGYASDYVYLATGTTASGANAPALVYIKHKYVGDDIHQVIYASPMTAEFEAGVIIVTIRYTKSTS